MLCSIDSAAATKSGSTWLDRLRSNKGFPTTAEDNLDLDHFLGVNAHSTRCDEDDDEEDDNERVTADNRNRNRNQKATSAEKKEEDKEWIGSVMSNVLSELFNMGDSERFSVQRKKSLRKQTNPKFCCVNDRNSSGDSSVRKDENVQGSTSASLNSDTNGKDSNVNFVRRSERERENGVEVEEEAEEKEEKEKEKELFGYSRSEVTVIDTSFTVWKFDKLLFRKKNIWKVRDKKGGVKSSKTTATLARKNKRKFAAAAAATASASTSASNDHNVNVVENNKKVKVSPPEFDSQNPKDNKKGQVCKDRSDDLRQVADRRSPRKSRKGTILLRGIPTSKNNEVRLAKNGFKDSQRQC